MTSDERTTKSAPTPKPASSTGEAASKSEGNKSEGNKSEGSKSEGSKSEGSEPSNYSRGEKQKPVTGSYKDNWNIIFGKKKKTRR